MLSVKESSNGSWPACRCWLAWRQLWLLRSLPARRIFCVHSGIEHDGHFVRWRLRRIHDCAGEALARVPDELSAIDGAPLMCAGITTFNALRNSGAQGGDVVAVLGIGGLGHLGVQYAAKMGFKTVASRAAKTRNPSPVNSARVITSTARRPIRRRN